MTPIRPGADALPPQVGRGRVDDVQDRQRRGRPHAVDPAMRRVARDRHRAASGRLQPAQPVHEPGQRVRAGAALGRPPVRHARIRPQHRRDVVLVALGPGQQRQPQHELRRGERAHAAQHAEDPAAAGLRFAHCLDLDPTAVPPQAAPCSICKVIAAPAACSRKTRWRASPRRLRLGVRSFELDVGITRDGVPVVHHDPALNPDIARGPDGAWLEARGPLLRDLSLADLAAFRCRPSPARQRLRGDLCHAGAA